MKKLMLMTAMWIVFTLSAQANIMFQKTYEVPGMKADEIKTAFGSLKMTQADSKLDQFGKALNMITQTAVDNATKEHSIKCMWWGTAMWYDADIILQARDGKYRVSIANVVDNKTGVTIDRAPKSLKKKCLAQMEQWADKKFETVTSLAF